MTPVDLPAGLAEPLRYLSSAWLWIPLYILLAAATAALLWWLRRRSRLAAEARGSRDGSEGLSRPARPSGILDEIQGLRRRVLEHDDYRKGCHELAFLLREHFTRRRGRRLFTLTAREIGGRIADEGVATLFALLAELQFRRAEPSRSDFEGICDIASESTGGHR